jgi:ferredoxin
MIEFYVVECGVRRRAVCKICEHCGKEFLERAKKKRAKKYCSVKCRSEAVSSKIEVNCASCDKIFYVIASRLASSKSGLLFCSRLCKNKTQKIGGIAEVLPSHYGTGQRNPDVYRRIYREANLVEKLKCERCGYCEFECGVDIHHKDGNEKNNLSVNLIALCSPCHRALHLSLWLLSEMGS